jgi:hypothetical protein
MAGKPSLVAVKWKRAVTAPVTKVTMVEPSSGSCGATFAVMKAPRALPTRLPNVGAATCVADKAVCGGGETGAVSVMARSWKGKLSFAFRGIVGAWGSLCQMP